VTGELGGAALALAHRLQGIAVAQADYPSLLARLELPQPRVTMGMALRGIASSCLDISDGLASDLGHILRASGVGADIELSRLPLPEALWQQPRGNAGRLALAGGDDTSSALLRRQSIKPAWKPWLAERGSLLALLAGLWLPSLA